MLCRSEPENSSRGGIGFWKLTNDTRGGFSQLHNAIALSSLTDAIQCDFVRNVLRNPIEFGKLSAVDRSEILDTLLSLPHYNAS
jgi:hypothetical protein